MSRWVLVVLFAACSSKKSQGLKPADDWGADQPGAQAATDMPPPMTGPMAKNTDEDIPDVVDENGNNPHAGLKRNAETDDTGGVDVAKLGGMAPDPNRKIDPTHRIAGTIAISPKTADKAQGKTLFVIVRQADASGNPVGIPLAVDKLEWTGKPIEFDVTEGQAMVNGTQMAGDVVVMARIDQDGDAVTKQPGDITGQVRVKVPATNANITLDTLLP